MIAYAPTAPTPAWAGPTFQSGKSTPRNPLSEQRRADSALKARCVSWKKQDSASVGIDHGRQAAPTPLNALFVFSVFLKSQVTKVVSF